MGALFSYGYTARWSGGYTHLLHFRARWYAPESGTFLSVDPVESEPPYQYVRGNVVNYFDPAGLQPPPCTGDPTRICITQPIGPGTNGYPPQPPTSIAPWTPPPLPPPAPSAWLDPYIASECSKFHFKAPGYAEGYTSILSLGIAVADVGWKEVVYDFATMERATYEFDDAPLVDPAYVPYLPGVTTPDYSVATLSYYVHLNFFNSELNMDKCFC